MTWDKTRLGWLMLVLVCALVVPATAFAEDEAKEDGEGENLNKVVVDIAAGIYSKYVYRGQLRVDDWVLQPVVDVHWRDFTFGGFGNWDLTDENGKKYEFSELRGYANYQFELGPAMLSAGAIGYFYPEASGDTLELYVKGEFDVILNPSLTIFRDIDEAKGWYIAIGASHTFGGLFKLSEKIGLSPKIWGNLGWADSGFNRAYYGHSDNGWADLTVGFDVPWRIADTFEIFAGAYFSVLIDSTARDRAKDPDNFWIGLGASITF